MMTDKVVIVRENPTVVRVVVGQALVTGGGGITELTGDVTASGAGSVVATIASGAVTRSKMANLATSTILGRASAGTGSPEELTAAQVRTILNVADGATAYTDEQAQDAVGAMVDGSLTYVDGTPLLQRAALTGAITAAAGLNTTALGSFTLSQLNTALSDADVATGGGTATGTNTGDQTITLTGDVTGSGTGSFAATIANSAVTNAKLANMPGSSIKAVVGGVSAVPGDLSLGANVVVGRLTGNIIAAQLATAQVADNAITNAKTADMATATIKGRVTAGTGDPEDLTGTQATTLLDTFTTSLKGLAPASGGGTTNFLRADGTWAAPPGGGGSPGGVSGEVQYNNGGAFAGAADVEIEGEQLRLPTIATPATPAANGLKLFGRKVGGRAMAAIMGPSGLDTALQPHSGRNRICEWAPLGNSTAVTASGMLAPTAVGTATAANVATTNRHQRARRIDHLVTVASTTAVAGWRSAAGQFTIGAATAGDGGFHFINRWGPAIGVATATSRAFVGMSLAFTPTDVEPSTRLNLVGMGWDAADANIQIMHNDGAGACTKIDLGSSFAVPTSDRTAYYEIAMFAPPGTTQEVQYEVTDLVSGAVATGTITTNIPSTTQLISPHGWMSVGGTSSVIGIALMSCYVEADL
jgi:hypothetical protein